ncbi:unnamed protein product [Dimorphilus gyrociliatus]|uniref:Uncharacterized protein n=1 Tax=Dimorphilus gyrociliatus TaxID=2664684 RepID=A0A7I8VLM0_9ANNE|nr:unnamed protein product [Dimorphilus gyrociliatus]
MHSPNSKVKFQVQVQVQYIDKNTTEANSNTCLLEQLNLEESTGKSVVKKGKKKHCQQDKKASTTSLPTTMASCKQYVFNQLVINDLLTLSDVNTDCKCGYIHIRLKFDKSCMEAGNVVVRTNTAGNKLKIVVNNFKIDGVNDFKYNIENTTIDYKRVIAKLTSDKVLQIDALMKNCTDDKSVCLQVICNS